MPVSAKITSKGQVTLPREIRERLGVQDGDRVRFEVENGAVVLYPQRGTPSFAGMVGLSARPADQGAVSAIDDLRHDPAERAALDAAPAHPNVTLLPAPAAPDDA